MSDEKEVIDEGKIKAVSADGKTEINLKYTVTLPKDDGEEEKSDA